MYSVSLVFWGAGQIMGGRVVLRSKRLGLRTRKILVFLDASGLISRYDGERPWEVGRSGRRKE